MTSKMPAWVVVSINNMIDKISQLEKENSELKELIIKARAKSNYSTQKWNEKRDLLFKTKR